MKKNVMMFVGIILIGSLAIAGEICPVSGDPVKNGLTSEYQGKSYGFCCKGCVRKFNKNPDKYLAKMTQSSESSHN